MALNIKILAVSMLIVFIATIAILFIADTLYKSKTACDKNKNIKVCKIGTIQIVVFMLILVVGGLFVVIITTGYILISGQQSV